MMTFSKVHSAGGAGSYYTNKDNYYVLNSMNERWYGKGAEMLGLSGSVDKKIFTAILEGKLPDGSDLTFIKDGRNQHRPGYDLTFSAPKSVSVMGLLGGDNRLIEAHNKAVDVALGQVERLAAVRSMKGGKSETLLTDNIVAALFNHDTSRDLDPQLHTHAVIANVTKNGDKWQALASDTISKTGFSEAVLANQIALGQIYRHTLRQQVEAMGYRVEVVGKHDMWEMVGVPTEIFSKRSKAINAVADDNSSLKSRDIATLDSRKNKTAYDPAQLFKQWIEEIKSTGFDIAAYKEEATKNTLNTPIAPLLSELSQEQVQNAVGLALSKLSDKQTQFTYSELMTKTVNYLPAEPGVFDLARKGINEAIEQQRIIPLDKEKGVFTSDIQLLDELSLKTLVQQHQKQGVVISNLSIDKLNQYNNTIKEYLVAKTPIAVISGIGGASVNRNRVAELANANLEQGRKIQILTPDNKSQIYLKDHQSLGKTTILNRSALLKETTFLPNSTLIVDQAEKFTLKEMVTLVDSAFRNNVQLVLIDNQQRKGTGNALSILREESPVFFYQRSKPVQASVISEIDKTERFSKLARDYVRTVGQGIESVAQVSGNREQKILTANIRDALKTQGLIGKTDHFLTVLKPVWLDSKDRNSRDSYHKGMVMEHWDNEKQKRERYVIERVTPQTNTITLVNANGEMLVEKIRTLNSQWSLYQVEKLAVSENENVKVLARENDGKLKSGDKLQVKIKDKESISLFNAKGNKVLSTTNSGDLFSALKLGQSHVEGIGASVSDKARVFVSVAQRDLNQPTLNQLARSGEKIVIYSAIDKEKTITKLTKNPHYKTLEEQIQQITGKKKLDVAILQQKNSLFTSSQQSINLAIPSLESQNMAFSQIQLLSAALTFSEKNVPINNIENEIQDQIKKGVLINIDVADGFGTKQLVTRTSYETEKSIIKQIADGKDAVKPLMEQVPDSVLDGLTQGQQNATKLILETPDRFIAVQGYAGVGKTTQFKAVLAAVNKLPDTERPEIIGLAPTHRAVSEMQAAGVNSQTLTSFLYEEERKIESGQQINYENTLFIVDESSMIGNSDMAKAYMLIAEGKGRAVMSGDSKQLQPIAAGQPFKLQQMRSTADVAVMKEIVRQTPELKPAIYKMIEGNIEGALGVIDNVTPKMVPRNQNAWMPDSSVMEFKTEDATLSKSDKPNNIYNAIVQDYIGRTDEARNNTIIITHLNDDRRAINELIHAERRLQGELLGAEVITPILLNSNIPNGELRKLQTWEKNIDSLVLKDKIYWTITGVDKESDTVSIKDPQGNEQVISPREASKEGINLYKPDVIKVSVGDRMRFTKSDNERGFIANSLWEVKSVSAEKLELSDGKQIRIISPGKETEHSHIDLAYAITTHGAQGASETFAITLEGVDGGRRRMVSQASAYVALSRAKQHVQVYTDNKSGWISALKKTDKRATVHDLLMANEDNQSQRAQSLLKQGKPLSDVAQGRALLRASGLKGESLGQFVTFGKKHPQNYMALPAFDRNGKPSGVWLSSLSGKQISDRIWQNERAQILGSKEADFVALQRSQNGETRLASSMKDAIELAAENPQSGIIVRLSNDAVPYNSKAMTGGSLWNDIPSSIDVNKEIPLPDNLPLIPDNGIEKMRKELEEQAKQITKSFEQKTQKSDVLMKKGLNDILDTLEKEPQSNKLTQEQKEAITSIVSREIKSFSGDTVRQVAHENLQRERLQQMERDIIKDLDKEKLIGE